MLSLWRSERVRYKLGFSSTLEDYFLRWTRRDNLSRAVYVYTIICVPVLVNYTRRVQRRGVMILDGYVFFMLEFEDYHYRLNISVMYDGVLYKLSESDRHKCNQSNQILTTIDGQGVHLRMCTPYFL